MNPLQRMLTGAERVRSGSPLTLANLVESFGFAGNQYGFIPSQTLTQSREEWSHSFEGYIQSAYRSNGVVFACMLARMLLFSEARFQYRKFVNGRPGKLFGDQSLSILENPWPNATTGDLLSRIIQDADLEGNFFATRRPNPAGKGQIVQRMRPDWVTIIAGGGTYDNSNAHPWASTELIGYAYHPGGRAAQADPILLLPEQVAHFAPIPDPLFRWRGMSWVTPIVREIMGDSAAMTHKLMFFENGATPNMAVNLGDAVKNEEQAQRWIAKLKMNNEGLFNAYKTLYLSAGGDAKIIGSNMQQIDFKTVQGHGETRICAAARVPPIIVGVSEGLEAATYSNYGQARRAFADATMRPLWRNVAGSLAPLVNVPNGAQLWYDDRDVPFLAEDQDIAATIQATRAQTIHTLIAAGYTPETVIAAVESEDFTLLAHSGMYSVQLQPAGSVTEGKGALVSGTVAPTNGQPDEQAAAGARLIASLRNDN